MDFIEDIKRFYKALSPHFDEEYNHFRCQIVPYFNNDWKKSCKKYPHGREPAKCFLNGFQESNWKSIKTMLVKNYPWLLLEELANEH